MKALDALVARVRRPKADPRLAGARDAHAAGDFVEARRLATLIATADDASLEAVRGLAELEYLLGNYEAAERLLLRLVEESRKDVATRADAEAALALVYFQTNRFAETRGLFAGFEHAVQMPIWELMRSFGEETPYRIDWHGNDAVTAPFTQTTAWELPRIAMEIDGLQIDARLDTGGELLTLSRSVAGELGLEEVSTATGVFAGGAQADFGYGRVETVVIGGVTVRAVPVAVAALDLPVVGTGFLRQFLATIDYSAGRLVLRPRTNEARRAFRAELEAAGAADVPFALALTHLIVARGSLDDIAPLTFLVDSGLQDEQGTSFAAPPETLGAAGIPIPATVEDVRESGAGHVPLQVGRFPIRRLGLGSVVQHDLTGFYGVFPDAWKDAAGFPIHGLVSHGFLRRYAWTLDFDAMTMTFR